MPHHVQHHHHHVRAAEPDPDVMTVQQTAYVTAAKTFDGPIAGYSTVGAEAPQDTPPAAAAGAPAFYDSGSQQAPPAPAANAGSQPDSNSQAAAGDDNMSFLNPPGTATVTPTATEAPQAAQSTTLVSSKAAAPVIQTPASSQSSQTSALPSSSDIASAVSGDTPSSTAGIQGSGSSPTAAAPPAAPEKSGSSGMSSGAQAGLAIGLLALVGILVAIAYFFYRRRMQSQREQHKKLDDEKNFNEKTGFDQMQPGLVPRVSVRKNGEQAPRLSMRPTTQMFGPAMSERQDTNGGFATAAVAGARAETNANAQREEHQNPFGDHAAAPVEAPKPLNISRPSTPTGQQSSAQAPEASAADIAAGAAPGPMNVHRVQLDFAPSMEDELGLKAGNLVRLLHEYDDGWALCIRLDRSQQGVCPRSCISKLPVKPRPGPPPGGPNGRRGPPPPGQRTRPNGPHGSPRMRAQTNGPNSRPMSPSANPFDDTNRSRSNSVGNPNPTRNSPPGNSPLNHQ